MKKRFRAAIGIAMIGACLAAAPPARAEVGGILWQFQRGSGFEASPALSDDGTVYIGSDDDRLYAVDRDGAEIWQFVTGGDIVSSPAVGADGTLYVGSKDGALYAVDRNGREKWRYAADGEIVSSPAIGADGTLYVCADDGFVYAVEDRDTASALRWRFRTLDAVRSSPVTVRDGTLYVGSDDDHLYAIADDGELKWRYRTGGDIRSTPAVGADGTLYVGSDDGFLYALTDAGAEGRLKWRFETGGPVRSSPTAGNRNLVYVGSDDGLLYALRDGAPSRTLEWTFETQSPIRSSPVIGGDGRIYFIGLDGLLRALDENGAEQWRVLLSESSGSPVISRDGTLYVGCEAFTGGGFVRSGPLYAVETDAGGILHEAPWPMFRHDVRHTGRNAANQGPQADAGGDQEVVDGQRVTLDGSDSTDPDYGIATFRWRQTAGDPVTLDGENDALTSFVAPEIDASGPLTFEITVTDNGGLTSTDTASVSVAEDGSFCFIDTAAHGFLPYIH
ncbi:PQQ-binding-like beta-propeller repeat protein [Desulfococcus sp.]|uniref:outer membrane protein assembly factor BamB family protein n=1 Tax=Desulfococcus sp. TaxID=2025834 RepID=UPI0035934412